MKPVAVHPDVERLVIDLLMSLLEPTEPDVDVGVDVPAEWSAGAPEFIQIAWDGTPRMSHPVAGHPTVRLTAWAHRTTRAKYLAAVSQALLCAHTGGAGISSIKPGVGILPTTDPDTGAPIASCTVRVTVRTQGL